jgi:hypothetical protein
MYLLTICNSFFENSLSNSCAHFFMRVWILWGLGLELSALHLQTRHSTTWATPLYFALVILEWGGVSRTICLGWPPTMILPIRITGMSHWYLTKV